MPSTNTALPRDRSISVDRGVALITLDLASPVPPFEQVRSQIAAQVSAGTLAAGARLPPVRRMAQDLGLAVNTVARAYRELETAGIVETRGRGGTIVTAAGNHVRARLQAAAADYAALVHDLGVTAEEALAIVHSSLNHSAPGQPNQPRST